MRLLLAATLMTTVAMPAFAADPGMPMEEPPAVFIWTGGYIGGQVGYAWGDSHYSNEQYGDYADYDPDGFFGGLYVGYNHQFANNMVLGIDADINISNVDGDADFYWNGVSPDPGASADLKYSGAVRARLGYAIDRFMPYVAGGLSVAKYDFGLADEFDESKTLTGWNIGAGVEYAATNNILVRAEYRYSDFGSKNYGQDWDGDISAKTDLKTNDIRFGIAYKF